MHTNIKVLLGASLLRRTLGAVSYTHLDVYKRQEAANVGAIAAIGQQDFITSNHRGHGQSIAMEIDLNGMMAEDVYKRQLNGRAMFIVAGAPANMDELKAAGIENFIHVRVNVLETLREYNAKLLKMCIRDRYTVE